MPYLEKQDQIWAKIFCISKNMHSRTPMQGGTMPRVSNHWGH